MEPTTRTASRSEAYAAIDSERLYQDKMRGNSRRENVEDNRDLGALILFMDEYVDKAKKAFSGPHPEGRERALSQVRKVAALGVLAMEMHGVYHRA